MLFIQFAFGNIKFYIIWILFVIFSICVHELFHALIALILGDDTGLKNGYVTINPIKQMGLISILALLFFGISWGKTPVNYRNLKTRLRIGIVAAAGPLANLILFFIFSFLAAILIAKFEYSLSNIFLQSLIIGATLNIVLLLFNILPIPALDGWAILYSIFPKIGNINSELFNGILFGIFIIIFFYFNKLFIIGNELVTFVINTAINNIL